MKKIFLFFIVLLSFNSSFSQTIESIIVDPVQLDSTVIDGKKYYILKTSLTQAQIVELGNATSKNNVQDEKISKAQSDIIVLQGSTGASFKPTRSINSTDVPSINSNDVGRDVNVTCSCNITVPQMPDGWYCYVWRKGTGTPKFKTPAGADLGSITVKGGYVKILSTGTAMQVSVR